MFIVLALEKYQFGGKLLHDTIIKVKLRLSPFENQVLSILVRIDRCGFLRVILGQILLLKNLRGVSSVNSSILKECFKFKVTKGKDT